MIWFREQDTTVRGTNIYEYSKNARSERFESSRGVLRKLRPSKTKT